MKGRKKLLPELFLGFLSFLITIFFILIVDPEKDILVDKFKFSPVVPFFVAVFFTVSYLSIFIFGSIRRGFLLGLFFMSFLLLQYLHYNNIAYTLILIAIVILIEFLFQKNT